MKPPFTGLLYIILLLKPLTLAVRADEPQIAVAPKDPVPRPVLVSAYIKSLANDKSFSFLMDATAPLGDKKAILPSTGEKTQDILRLLNEATGITSIDCKEMGMVLLWNTPDRDGILKAGADAWLPAKQSLIDKKEREPGKGPDLKTTDLASLSRLLPFPVLSAVSGAKTARLDVVDIEPGLRSMLIQRVQEDTKNTAAIISFLAWQDPEFWRDTELYVKDTAISKKPREIPENAILPPRYILMVRGSLVYGETPFALSSSVGVIDP